MNSIYHHLKENSNTYQKVVRQDYNNTKKLFNFLKKYLSKNTKKFTKKLPKNIKSKS